MPEKPRPLPQEAVIHLSPSHISHPLTSLTPVKLYLIAGEASGDLHGANLIRALKMQQPGLHCRVWGGDLMQAAGGEVVKHYRELAFMGFVEVARNLRTIFRNIDFCKSDILAYQPDALVLIDYPGFNLRIARWARQQGLRVIYYISPQIWAWHSSRVQAIRRDVDEMLVILPFETAFFEKYGVKARFVGHPLLDAIDTSVRFQALENKDNIIALLPGSRQQEIKRILPVMLRITSHFPEYQFEVAGAASLPPDFYQPFLEKYPHITLHIGQTYALLGRAKAALVKSGTSTLEAALFQVPQVVCYAGNPLSYAIARRLVNVPYISLVNLIMDRPLVRELIQNELTTSNLRVALADILDPAQAAELQAGYAELRQRLGDGGASGRAATAILEVVRG